MSEIGSHHFASFLSQQVEELTGWYIGITLTCAFVFTLAGKNHQNRV